MNKIYFEFVNFLPFVLHFVIFNSFNTTTFVLSCQGGAVRSGKNLQIFKTYKKRPASDVSQDNRIVKTIHVFPENYPTAGTNNAYLDINDQVTSDAEKNRKNTMIEDIIHSVRKKGMLSEEPITEDFPLPTQEKNEETIETINKISQKEEEEEIEKEGSGNKEDVQEKYVDNLRRRGELGSTRKSNEDSSSKRKEHGLLDDEEIEEGSGMHGGQQEKNEAQERNSLVVKKRNSDDLEYGKMDKNLLDLSFEKRITGNYIMFMSIRNLKAL